MNIAHCSERQVQRPTEPQDEILHNRKIIVTLKEETRHKAEKAHWQVAAKKQQLLGNSSFLWPPLTSFQVKMFSLASCS
jgi:hypothetical protein